MTGEQPNPVLFLDCTHGKLIRELLRRVGLSIATHSTFAWPRNKPDIEWIAECGRFNWAIISGDKRIEEVPEERQAVINAKCKVFMFDDSHITRTEDWAASFLVARHRVLEIIAKADGPFFVTIKPCRTKGHISTPRFISQAGGGWKKPDEPPSPVVTPLPVEPAPSSHPQQASFQFIPKKE